MNADKIQISEGNRTKEEHQYLRNIGVTTASYEGTSHCAPMGHTAADVMFFTDGNQLNPMSVAKTAATISGIKGIGVYNNYTHIDLRNKIGDPDIWPTSARKEILGY